MTTRNVADYRGEVGAPLEVASAVLSLPLLDLPIATAVTFPAYLDRPARVLRGARLEGEHPAPVHHLRQTAPKLRGGQKYHRVMVSPGGLQISTRRREGWEARRAQAPDVAALTRELARLTHKLEMVGRYEPWYESYELQSRMLDRVEEIRHLLGVARRGESVRGPVVAWSKKSQRNMVRRIASLDWTGFEREGWVAAMLTLTYPGDWTAYAPGGATAKRHLRAFRAWYARRTDGLDQGLWKLEFQGRGAPHFHLLLLVPQQPFARAGCDSFADECRAAWWRIIRAGVPPRHGPFTSEHRNPDTRHVAADGRVMQGCSIDLSEGARMLDPVRIGNYFAAHGRHAGKDYQHVVPREWLAAAEADDSARPGRWWGVWRLDPVEFSGELDYDDTVQLRRMLRSWIGAQGPRSGGLPGSPVIPRAYRRDVWRIDQDGRTVDRETGEVLAGRARRRRVHRRFTLPTLAHPVPTGYVLINDAPALVRQLARAFVEPGDWPSGKPRPLP